MTTKKYIPLFDIVFKISVRGKTAEAAIKKARKLASTAKDVRVSYWG